MDTSRKISEETILLLDELEKDMKQRGVRTTQKEIIESSIKVAAKHEEQLFKTLAHTDNTREMTERFLRNEGKFDFGKRWLEEIDEL